MTIEHKETHDLLCSQTNQILYRNHQTNYGSDLGANK